MKPAVTSERKYESTKVLVVQNCGNTVSHTNIKKMSSLFKKGDVLVVNRSGTFPSSFNGVIERSSEPLEIRLAAFEGNDLSNLRFWKAVSFGEGDWKRPTELRGLAPVLRAGDVIRIEQDLSATVLKVNPSYPRLLDLEFHSENFLMAAYRSGRPIQYSYLKEELEVWDQQTLFAGIPISVEPPSAALPLNWEFIFSLEKRGVKIAPLLHSAGLSSTGDEEFDKLFPLDEFYEIPDETINLIRNSGQYGGRIIALGTTVIRAIETAFADPENVTKTGRSNLRLGKATPLKICDVLITGMHEEGTSHAGLMQAFCGLSGRELLQKIANETGDYRSHEYGDLTFLLK